ncbi:putative AAA domain-containing protein P22H7.05c [Camellia lanceoleosa]|uniref:AAA domain-containing protein P22H7.05c n=1 Tax=Camellia lanceoleosa TaxID=1840588 RepID=A0ACC0G7K2_9ERIC|nr:putative AAA domain-containing protein P22H7.05c [Camellia lanceoleosa]
MRQVGVLCTATLVAVQENVRKLESDHNNAKFLARKFLEMRKLSNDAWRKDVEAGEKWLENCGEDEEFLKRESKRLHRDLLRIAPVYIGGSNSENEKQFQGWESFFGLQDVIRCMKEVVILPLLYPEFFSNMGLTPPRGVLLHGYPGTGKTLVVRALIGSCACGDKWIAYFARKGADCLGKYVGDAERQLRLLFEFFEKSIIALRRNCPLQEILSAAEKKASHGKRPPLPTFAVEKRDWLESLACAPPPSSQRGAGMAANYVVSSPLRSHLIPCLRQPLSRLLVSLYLDERLLLPPHLYKAATLIKSVIVSALDEEKVPSDHCLASVKPSALISGVLNLDLIGFTVLYLHRGGNDASHSAEATARRGSTSFARPDVDMHSRSGMATLSTIGAVASAMGLAVEKSSKVVCSKPKFPSNFAFYVFNIG